MDLFPKYLKGFVVYLHEKGQFWPRPDMNIIGQSKPITIRGRKEIVGQFSITKIEMISQPRYSFTKCLNNYIQKQTGCKMEWNIATVGPSLCPFYFNLKEYHGRLTVLTHTSARKLTKMT